MANKQLIQRALDNTPNYLAYCRMVDGNGHRCAVSQLAHIAGCDLITNVTVAIAEAYGVGIPDVTALIHLNDSCPANADRLAAYTRTLNHWLTL